MSVTISQLSSISQTKPPKTNWYWVLRILAVAIFVTGNLLGMSESSFMLERISLRQASNQKEQDAQHKRFTAWEQEQKAYDEKTKLIRRQGELLAEGKKEDAELRSEIEKQEQVCRKLHLEYEALGDQISFIHADYGNTLDLLLAHRGLRLANARLIAFLVAIGLLVASFIPWFFSKKSPPTILSA